MRKVDVIIVGGGPGGVAAAIWCKRLGLAPLVLESRTKPGGQLRLIHNRIIDYPGLPANNGAELQERLIRHLEELGCEVVTEAQVEHIDPHERIVSYRISPKAAPTEVIHHVQGEAIILAMGACDRRLGVPGEAELHRRGEVYSASRDCARFAGRQVAVVGGGDRAFEGALLLARSGADVRLIHRSGRFRARPEFVEPVLAHPHIQMLDNARITAIHGDDRLEAITVERQDQPDGRLAVDALFVRIGVEPNSRLVRGLVETDEKGFVITDREGRTSTSTLYAIGDLCTHPAYSSISSAVGQGMITAKAIYLELQKGGNPPC